MTPKKVSWREAWDMLIIEENDGHIGIFFIILMGLIVGVILSSYDTSPTLWGIMSRFIVSILLIGNILFILFMTMIAITADNNLIEKQAIIYLLLPVLSTAFIMGWVLDLEENFYTGNFLVNLGLVLLLCLVLTELYFIANKYVVSKNTNKVWFVLGKKLNIFVPFFMLYYIIYGTVASIHDSFIVIIDSALLLESFLEANIQLILLVAGVVVLIYLYLLVNTIFVKTKRGKQK